MPYIHSGVNRPDLVALLAQEHAAGMVTARVAREPCLQEAFRRWPQVPLYLDSGFRRQMPLHAYIDLIEACGRRFTWIANLDCLFDQAASDAHYDFITSRLSSPALRAKLLWIYQGGTHADLACRAHEYGLVGIGGCVLRMMHQGVTATMRWLAEVGEVLMGVNAQAHLFGIGNKPLLCWLAGQQWVASCDSSKWLLAYKARKLLLASGQLMDAPGLSTRELAAKNMRVIEQWFQSPRARQEA